QSAATVAEVGYNHHGLLALDSALGKDVHAGYAQVAPSLLDLSHDVGRPHEDDVEPRMARDGCLVLTVAGAADLVAGRLEELDYALVEMPFRRHGKADRVDRLVPGGRGHRRPSSARSRSRSRTRRTRELRSTSAVVPAAMSWRVSAVATVTSQWWRQSSARV